MAHPAANAPLDAAQHMALRNVEQAVRTYGPAPGARAMMNAEEEAARMAQASGRYVTWRSLADGQDCCRIGPKARCFCGHTFAEHTTGGLGGCQNCSECTRFAYMPSRPEEVGEWWLPRRKGFDVRHWRAKCQCGHGHDVHSAIRGGRCAGRIAPPVRAAAPRRAIANHGHPDPASKALAEGRPCGCRCFVSAFRCVVCEASWEEHDVVVETEAERRAQGREVGDAYLPLAAAPGVRDAVFGEEPAGTAHLRPAWRPAEAHGATEGAFLEAMQRQRRLR